MGRNFRAITRIGNTVLGHVMLMQDEGRLNTMDENLYRAVLLYKATMSKAKLMLKQGLITADEYAEIDTIIANKYGLNSSVIYR